MPDNPVFQVHSPIPKHLMSPCHVPGSVVGTRDAGDSKTASSLAVVRIPVSAAGDWLPDVTVFCWERNISCWGQGEEFCSRLTHLPRTQDPISSGGDIVGL